MRPHQRTFLTDDDIRYEFRVMARWCRLFGRTAEDWVRTEAARFRERYPLVGSSRPGTRAA